MVSSSNNSLKTSRRSSKGPPECHGAMIMLQACLTACLPSCSALLCSAHSLTQRQLLKHTLPVTLSLGSDDALARHMPFFVQSITTQDSDFRAIAFQGLILSCPFSAPLFDSIPCYLIHFTRQYVTGYACSIAKSSNRWKRTWSSGSPMLETL